MRIGIHGGSTTYKLDLGELAKRAEALGFEHILVGEHPIIPVEMSSPFPGAADGAMPSTYAQFMDPLIALARVAGVTQRIKLGTGVCLVPERNPIILAKQVATLDHLSGGRFIFGIGAGWLREESEIMGVDFPHRWTQTREAVLAMKELWTRDESEFHGRYYDFPPVRCFPKPAQKPHPPILIGAQQPNERAFRRIVDWADGWMPPVPLVPIEEVKRGRAVLDELAPAAGRDPRSIDIMAFGYAGTLRSRDELEELESAGVHWASVGLKSEDESAYDELEELAATLL